MFGGETFNWKQYYYDSSDVIAAFRTDEKKWYDMGKLKSARHFHGVIIYRGKFLILGGKSLSFGEKKDFLRVSPSI